MRLSCYWSWISSSHCQSSLRIHSAIASWIHSYFDNVNFTVACSVTRPLNGSEAPGDLLLRQTSQLLLCKSSCSYAKLVGSNYVTSTLTMWNLFFRNNVEITLRLFFSEVKNSWHEEDSNTDHRTTKRKSYPPNHRCHYSKVLNCLTRNPNPNIKADRKQSKLM